MTRQAGFTLLEVLVALAILAAVSLVVIKAVGDGMVQIGDSAWKDQAVRLGRMKLGQIDTSKGAPRGTFAPDCPAISWHASISPLEDVPGRHIELVVREGAKQVVLERIIIP